MKRGRPATRGAARRVLRRRNVVRDEDDSEGVEEKEEAVSEDEDEAGDAEEEEEEEEEETPKKLTRAQAKKQQEEEAERKRTAKRPVRRARTASKEKSEEDEEEEEEEEDDDEEEEEEEEEEEDDDDEDDEDDDEEEEADESEAERNKRSRGAKKPQLRGARAPPLKKQKRKIIETDEDEDADEDANPDVDMDAAGDDASNEDKETVETPAGKTAVVEGTEEGADSPLEEPPAIEPPTPNEAASASEADANEAASVRSEASSVAATPTASPTKRKGLSMDTIMNDAEEAEDTRSKSELGENVPDQNIREQLDNVSSEQELLSLLTEGCGRIIKDHRSPSRLFAVGVLVAAKQRPERFAAPSVLKYLLRLLRSKHYIGQKDPSASSDSMHPNRPGSSAPTGGPVAAGSPTVDFQVISLPVLVANVLVHVLKDVDNWPEDSVKVFLDDSLYSRYWVDHELSQLFVRNVKTIVHATTLSDDLDHNQPDKSGLVRQRFHEIKVGKDMRDLIVNHIRLRLSELEKEKGGAHGGGTASNAMRNVILTLTDFASYPQARVLAAENMEAWLQNPSVKGPSRELLTKIVVASGLSEDEDRRTVDLLLKMKLKSTMFQTKVEAVTQLVRTNQAYLKQALGLFIARERPNNMGKDIDNIKMVQHIFRAVRATAAGAHTQADDAFYRSPTPHLGSNASRELAHVVRELASVADVAPVLKTIVRKVLKQLTFEQVDVRTLCVGILDNDGHWDSLTGDARLLDYIGLVTGIVWMILLTRGSAVKNLQIQQSNVSSRQPPGSSSLGSGNKLGGAQPIPRRNSQPLGHGRSHHKIGGPRDGKMVSGGAGKAKQHLGKTSSNSSIGSGQSSVAGSGTPGGTAVPGNATPPPPSDSSNKSVSVAIKAKEELQQALAYVQREAIVCCRGILQHFELSGESPFEKMLYEAIVKKLLFLEIPSDVQPTEHDRTCFMSTKEGIPVHQDSLQLLCELYNSCKAIDRMEALRTLESVVFRAAEGQLQREQLWRNHEDDLKEYNQNGGVIGVEVQNSAFVAELLKLTMWNSRGEHTEHEFCHASRFWVCCSILLIVGCFNPSTVGKFLWHEVPTLRSMMQMVITGQFTFPVTSSTDPHLLGKHRSTFSDVAAVNQQLIDYEEQVAQLVQDPIAAEDPLMVFELNGIARQPPPAILEHLRTLDRKFKLGVRLRQARSPDFLTEMVSENDGMGNNAADFADSAWWIADIVCEDFETVQYLPHGCLCKLLLLALRGRNAVLPGTKGEVNQAPNEGQSTFNQSTLRSIIPRLLLKLREYLADENEKEGVASSVILYYLDCLSSTDVAVRHVASQVLHLLTSSNASSSTTDTDSTSTPLTSDIESMEDEILAYDSVLSGGQTSGSMAFGWISELVKFPCYEQVRPKIFSSLEGLFERESSVAALRSCVKALYDFGNEDSTEDTDATMDGSSSRGNKSAIEKSLMLAGAYGRLLSGREFVAKLLLQDREIFSVIVEVMWRVIDLQLVSGSQLKASSGISFSDCKVFYVADSANAIREIKLPLPVIHGAILALCSPHARSASGSSMTSSKNESFHSKLTQSLFPKATSGTTILASTGLIATKDRRLYPDHLLVKLASSSSDLYLCRTAVRAMTCEAAWGLLQLSALGEPCFGLVAQTLLDAAKANESKTTTSLVTATGCITAQDAASVVLSALTVYDLETDPASVLSQTTTERLSALEIWLRRVRDKTNDGEMAVDEDEFDRDEDDLLSEGFASVAIGEGVSRLPRPTKPFYSAEFVITVKSQPDASAAEKHPIEQSEMAYFASNYLRGVETSHSMISGEGERYHEVTDRGVIAALAQTLLSSCGADPKSSQSESWQVRMSMLHYVRLSCCTRERAIQVANAMLDVLHHVCQCHDAAHRCSCLELVQDCLRNLRDVLGYSETASFVQHIVNLNSLDALSSVTAADVSHDVEMVLGAIADFATESISRWEKIGQPLVLDGMTLHDIVLLLKDIAVLRDASSLKGSPDTHSSLLVLMLGESLDAGTLVNVIDAVVSTVPRVTSSTGNVLQLHDQIRREMIGVLYFKNPKQVAVHLDSLYPGWKALVNVESMGVDRGSGGGSRGDDLSALSDPKLVAFVDDTLRHLKRDGSEVIDRFREVARRHPLLVLSRFPKQLMDLIGAVSLTRLYLNTTHYQNILQAMEIVRPCLRSHMQTFPLFSQFAFQLLGVIADHHATDFYPLIARVWDIFYDALDADYDLASEHIFSPSRCIVLRVIVELYAGVHADVSAFADLMAARGSQTHFCTTLESIQAARDKKLMSASQVQQIDRLLKRLTAVQIEDSSALNDLNWNEVDLVLQSISQLCTRTRQQEGPTASLLRQCGPPLTKLLTVATLTKAAMSTLCQALVALARSDPDCAQLVTQRYVACLRSLRPAVRESAVAFALDFVSLADEAQRQELLQFLFEDTSDIARTKLIAYLKSSAFRNGALALIP